MIDILSKEKKKEIPRRSNYVVTYGFSKTHIFTSLFNKGIIFSPYRGKRYIPIAKGKLWNKRVPNHETEFF